MAALSNIALAPLIADLTVNPQISQWRRAPVFADDDQWLSTANITTPHIYTVPQLLPMLNNVEQSRAQKEILIGLQSWEGVVLDVGETTFAVRLVDVSGDHPDEEVELAKEELCDFDIALLEPGAIFYWTIGYRQQLPRGARERVSRIRLRRVPAWTKSQLAEARERAEALARELNW